MSCPVGIQGLWKDIFYYRTLLNDIQVLHKYVLCIPGVLSLGNRDKVLLVEGVGERQTDRERESERGKEGGRGFSNKLPEHDCSPRVHPPPLDRSL